MGIFDRLKKVDYNIEEDCNNANNYYFGKGVDIDKRKAAELFERAATNGNAYAQLMIGYMYDFGEGIEQNTKKAIKWYEKASNSGEHNATLNLANIYLYGRGISKDIQKANTYLKQAAECGNGMAASSLGNNYAMGLGVEKSLKQAIYWIEKAKSFGYIDSDTICNLGCLYKEKGEYTLAFECFEKALDIDSNNLNAQFMYGNSLYFGLGVDRDIEEAKKHLQYCYSQNPNDLETKSILDEIYMYEYAEQCIDAAIDVAKMRCGIGDFSFYIHIITDTMNNNILLLNCFLERWDNSRMGGVHKAYYQDSAWERFTMLFDEKKVEQKIDDDESLFLIEKCDYSKLLAIYALDKESAFKIIENKLKEKDIPFEINEKNLSAFYSKK